MNDKVFMKEKKSDNVLKTGILKSGGITALFDSIIANNEAFSQIAISFACFLPIWPKPTMANFISLSIHQDIYLQVYEQFHPIL